MTAGQADPPPSLFSTRWVHVFEEDSHDGARFRPADGDIPLSRRPRARLELDPDGGARWSTPDAGDRPTPRAGRWHEEGDVLVVEIPGGPTLRIIERGPEGLRAVIAPSGPR
ncbi:MAG: hypothetical protein AB7G23_09655 [Vicinamibacterales bacterium]